MLTNLALTRGDTVTLFNRGKTNPCIFSAAENIVGDRDSDLNALVGRTWDAVVDFSGYIPRLVKKSAEILSKSVGQYIFISTVSVYKDLTTPQIDEDSPLGKLTNPDTEEITGETYGPLKVLCEQEVIQQFSRNSLIIRPGVIVGPYDPTDRFTYWVNRISQGGDVAAPGNPDQPVQFIDGHDLAEWILLLLDKQTTGVFNAIGFNEPITMGSMLETCSTVSQSNANFIWLLEKFLLDNNVAPWKEMPIWLPVESEGGLGHIDNVRATEAGLTFRLLHTTVSDTLKWINEERQADAPWKAGITRDRERQLLEMYSK